MAVRLARDSLGWMNQLVGAATLFEGQKDQLVNVGQTRSHNSFHDAPTVAFVNGLIDSSAEHGHFDTLEARQFSALEAHYGNAWTSLPW